MRFGVSFGFILNFSSRNCAISSFFSNSSSANSSEGKHTIAASLRSLDNDRKNSQRIETHCVSPYGLGFEIEETHFYTPSSLLEFLAQEPRFALEWSGAAGSITLNLSALWEVAAGRMRENASQDAQRVWDERWGDRKTELVFVAARCSDRPKIYRELSKALLQDEEMKYDLTWWGSQSSGALESVVESAQHVFKNHPAVEI